MSITDVSSLSLYGGCSSLYLTVLPLPQVHRFFCHQHVPAQQQEAQQGITTQTRHCKDRSSQSGSRSPRELYLQGQTQFSPHLGDVTGHAESCTPCWLVLRTGHHVTRVAVRLRALQSQHSTCSPSPGGREAGPGAGVRRGCSSPVSLGWYPLPPAPV